MKKAQALSRGGNQLLLIRSNGDIEPHFRSIENCCLLVVLDGRSDVGNTGANCTQCVAQALARMSIRSGVKTCNLEAILRTSSAAALEPPIAACASTGRYDSTNSNR